MSIGILDLPVAAKVATKGPSWYQTPDGAFMSRDGRAVLVKRLDGGRDGYGGTRPEK